MFLACLAVATTPPDWRLTAELTDFAETGRYAEAVEFCRRLDAASPKAKMITYGRSPAMRALVRKMILQTFGACFTVPVQDQRGVKSTG